MQPWHGLANFAAYCLLAGAVAEVMRRSLGIAIVIGVVMPMCILPQVSGNISEYPEPLFFWLKFVTIAITANYCTFLRYGRIGGTRVPALPRKWAFCIALIVVIINISEAVAFDAKNGGYYNAASGVFVMLATPLHAHTTLTFGGKFTDLMWLTNSSHKQQAAWNWGYTIWNCVFVLGNVRYIRPLCHIVTPMLLSAAWKPELWMQYRTYCLHINMVFLGAFGEKALRSAMPVLEDLPNDVLTALGIAGLVYNVVVFIFIRFNFVFQSASRNGDCVASETADPSGSCYADPRTPPATADHHLYFNPPPRL